MRQHYKIHLTYFILIAMIAGSGLFLFGERGSTQVDMCDCKRGSESYPDCNPDNTDKDYIRECWKKGPPCPLNAAN